MSTAAWFKSTFSGSEKTCVEVAHRDDTVLIRDSKYAGEATDQPTVCVHPIEWRSFLDLVLTGDSGTVEGVAVTLLDDGATITGQAITLAYSHDEWDAFTKGVADGQFDRQR